MQAERIRERAGDVGSEAVVCVSRDGDHRTGWALADGARDPVIATVSGGRSRPLPRPMVAVILDCTAITVPAGVNFGHHCGHGEGPHPIRVVVHEHGTSDVTYAALREAAERRMSVQERGTAARALRRAAAIHERGN